MADTPRVTVPVEELIAELRDYLIADRRRKSLTVPKDFGRRLLSALSAAPAPEGGAVDGDAFKIATDLHTAFEKLIYGLPKYLEAENLTDEENMIREAWITLDVTAHRLAALATREEAPAEAGERIVGTIAHVSNGRSELPELVASALRAQPQAREDALPVAALRPVVLAFAHLMEAKLKENDWKRGWKKDSALALLGRLREETAELDEKVQARSRFQLAINPPPALRLNELIANEAADVANFAMMVADVCGGLPDSAVRSISESTPHPAPDALRGTGATGARASPRMLDLSFEGLGLRPRPSSSPMEIAVAALRRIKDPSKTTTAISARVTATEALAALQAEQKGGAA